VYAAWTTKEEAAIGGYLDEKDEQAGRNEWVCVMIGVAGTREVRHIPSILEASTSIRCSPCHRQVRLQHSCYY